MTVSGGSLVIRDSVKGSVSCVFDHIKMDDITNTNDKARCNM